MGRENKYARSSRGGPGQASADLCHHSLWPRLHSPPERRAQWLRRLNFPLRKQTGAAVQTRPSRQQGSAATPGSSGLPSPPTWLAPGLALGPPNTDSLGQTNKRHLHSQGRAVRRRELMPPALCRGELDPIGFALSPHIMTPRPACYSCWKKNKKINNWKITKKFCLPAILSFAQNGQLPPKQMGRHLKNVLCLWGHVVFPIII